MENYITIKDLTKIYKVNRKTVHQWILRGMPSYKFGGSRRFIFEEVDKWQKEINTNR